MRDWLQETHGPTFELLRHFLLRFFDSELVTTPGQTALAVIGSSTMFLTWFPFFTGPLKERYQHLSALATPQPYRLALRADHLWLITMLMSAMGLLTAIKAQSLYPSRADYRVMGWMPLRTRQIFGAKLAALLIVATSAIVVLNLLPSVGFPALSGGRWAFEQSIGNQMVALLAASVAASYFTFFALVAVQGVFRKLQGLIAAAMLILLVMSFSIGPSVARTVVRPQLANWLPPVWFLGLCQTMSGDPDRAMHALAHRALAGLEAAILLTLAAYALSYRRHRALMMESPANVRKDRRWYGVIFDWLVPDPRQQAVIVFLAKAISSNGPHRMIFLGYGGFALAVVMTVGFAYLHVVLLAFFLISLRHAFSIPVELRANWAFRITEGEGREHWRRAVDRFVLCFGALSMLVVPFPWEVRVLGWRALSESALFAMLALASYEVVFANWDKLPFTCSYLPGKKPVWMVTLRLFALLVSLPLVNAILMASLHNPFLYGGLFFALLAIWVRSRRARRENWAETRLKYDEAPDPAIHSLNLLRN